MPFSIPSLRILVLKKGMETVEERARHELGMVKEGETLYQLPQK